MYSNRDPSFMGTDSITEQFHRNVQGLKSRSMTKFEPKLYEMGQIKKYLDINKPLLTQQKREVIEEKLELQKKAEVFTKKRLKDNDYFMKYGHNPFMNLSNTNLRRYIVPDRSKSNTPNKQTEEYEMSRDIVEAVNEIKQNNFKVNTMKFDRQCMETARLASKIKEKTTRKTATIFSIKDQKDIESSQKSKNLSFDDIIQIKEDNFFTTQQKNINIFKIARGSTAGMMTNDILVKYHFNFISMIEKIQTFVVPVFRDLSKLGRRMILTRAKVEKNTRLDVLRSADLTFKLSDIRYGDILNVSSGRINPELCYSILYEGNAEHDLSPSSTLIEDGDIPYDENKNQNMMNYANPNDEAQEIVDYKRLENTHEEQLNEIRCQKFYENVEEILEKKTKICSATIRDKPLHRQLDREVNRNLEQMLKYNKGEDMPNDRLIRFNKTNKNRSEHIKIRKLLDTIVLKNKQEERISILMNKASIR